MADEGTTNTQDAEGVQGEGGSNDANPSPEGVGSGEDTGSLMSRSAQEGGDKGGKPATDSKDGKPDADNKDADPLAKVPDTPEGYELTFGKDTVVDEALLASFRGTAKELGLTQGQAQKLGALYEGHMAKAAERFEVEQTKHLLDARKAWEAEIKASPTFNEDLGRIQSALREFGDQELYDLLDQTNLGSHPKMFAFMAKVGRALGEPGMHGERASAAKSAAEVLYPTMNK